MKKQNKKKVLFVLFMLILAVGYYLFKISSDVSGVAEVGQIDVIFTKIGKITEVDSSGATAEILNDGKRIVINAPNLKSGSAVVKIPVTLKNNGYFPVKLDSILEYGNPSDSSVEVEYTGIGVSDKELASGETKEFFINIYSKNVNMMQTVNFGFEFKYVQSYLES